MSFGLQPVQGNVNNALLPPAHTGSRQLVQRRENFAQFTRSQPGGLPQRQTQWIQTQVSQRLNAPPQSIFPAPLTASTALSNQQAIENYRSIDNLGRPTRSELPGRFYARI